VSVVWPSIGPSVGSARRVSQWTDISSGIFHYGCTAGESTVFLRPTFGVLFSSLKRAISRQG